MSVDPLSSAKYSVQHSKRRISELEAEIIAFSNTRPYTEFMQHDRKTGEDVFKVKLSKPMPERWKGSAFDAITPLRSALDHAGFAVATASGNKGKNAHFPFGGTLQDAEMRKNGRSKDIPKEVFDVMIASKPYRGGNDLLWALNKLCNTNKHEIIVPLITQSHGFSIQGATISGTVTLSPRWDRTKNELEVARLGKGGKIQGNFEFTFFVAIGDVDFVRGQPVIGVLNTVSDEVGRILMAIEAEARRIGIF